MGGAFGDDKGRDTCQEATKRVERCTVGGGPCALPCCALRVTEQGAIERAVEVNGGLNGG